MLGMRRTQKKHACWVFFTHHRVTLDVWRCPLLRSRSLSSIDCQWDTTGKRWGPAAAGTHFWIMTTNWIIPYHKPSCWSPLVSPQNKHIKPLSKPLIRFTIAWCMAMPWCSRSSLVLSLFTAGVAAGAPGAPCEESLMGRPVLRVRWVVE